MPLLQNAKKALRVSKRKTAINARIKSQMKTALKAVETAPAKDTASEAFRRVDRAVKRNLIPKNRAARLKSQIGRKTAAKQTASA